MDENYIYLLGSGIRRVELRTGKVSDLEIPSNRNVALDGGNIYYLTADDILTRYDIKNGELSNVCHEAVSDFRLTADGLSVTTSAGVQIIRRGRRNAASQW